MAAWAASTAITATSDESGDPLAYINSIAIFIIVLINASIAAFTENSANGALEALESLASPQSTVIRDGEEKIIDSRVLVRGDIIKLGTGDVVPADMRLVTASDMKVNEMLLTGESEDVNKSIKMKPKSSNDSEKLTADNMAFSSCTVKAGSATGMVVLTGMRTKVGTIATLLNNNSGNSEKKVQDNSAILLVESHTFFSCFFFSPSAFHRRLKDKLQCKRISANLRSP